MDTGPLDPGATRLRAAGAMISERGERSKSELVLAATLREAQRAVPVAHSANTGGTALD